MWYKQAFDKKFLSRKKQTAKGLFGAYYNNFSPKELEQIKRQIGNFHSLGIKKFHKGIDKYLIIEENLNLLYFSKAINELTNLRAPVVGSISLSSIISNRITITQHMPGVDIRKYTTTDYRMYIPSIKSILEEQIVEKLRRIGLRWADCHAGNYLVDPKKVEECIALLLNNQVDKYNVNEQWSAIRKSGIDLSSGASILDFGMMQVARGSAAAKLLQDFENKIDIEIKKHPYNGLLLLIKNVIGNIIVDDHSGENYVV